MDLGFGPIQGAHNYDRTIDQVKFADQNGMASVFLQEHHEDPDLEQYWPDPVTALGMLATHTDNVQLGTGILLLPFYHPARFAERAAMVDGMSDGRFVLGAAVGYRPREFEIFHQPRSERGAIYEEYLEVITRCWTEASVTFDGEYYQVEEFQCTPRPANDDRPTVWVGGYAPVVLDRAARFIERDLVDAWFPGTQPTVDGLVERREKFDEMLAGYDVDPDTVGMPLLRDGIIAPTTEEAEALANEYLVEGYKKQYQGRGHGSSSSQDLGHDVLKDDDFDAQDLIQDRFIVGSPEDWVRELNAYEAALGVDHVVTRIYFDGMTHTDVMDQLHLLCDEVVPHV